MPLVQMESTELESIVDFIADATPVIKQAEAQEAATQAALPDTVDALIKAGFLRVTDRQNAISSLSNPVNMLESLRKVAESKIAGDKTAKEAPAVMGKTAEVASAVSANTSDNADDTFLRRFGL